MVSADELGNELAVRFQRVNDPLQTDLYSKSDVKKMYSNVHEKIHEHNSLRFTFPNVPTPSVSPII